MQIERVGLAMVELPLHRIDEVGHHGFGAAVNEVSILLGLVQPVGGGTCSNLNLYPTCFSNTDAASFMAGAGPPGP